MAADGCLVTWRIASICCVCKFWSTDEKPTHVWENKFYCRGCCPYDNPPPKQWDEEQSPVTGEQNLLF